MMMEYVLARVDEKHGAQVFVEVFTVLWVRDFERDGK